MPNNVYWCYLNCNSKVITQLDEPANFDTLDMYKVVHAPNEAIAIRTYETYLKTEAWRNK